MHRTMGSSIISTRRRGCNQQPGSGARPNTTSGTYPGCNYVVFGGVTPATLGSNAISFVVAPSPTSGNNGGVAGVQLVPSGAGPTYLEHSSTAATGLHTLRPERDVHRERGRESGGYLLSMVSDQRWSDQFDSRVPPPAVTRRPPRQRRRRLFCRGRKWRRHRNQFRGPTEHHRRPACDQHATYGKLCCWRTLSGSHRYGRCLHRVELECFIYRAEWSRTDTALRTRHQLTNPVDSNGFATPATFTVVGVNDG